MLEGDRVVLRPIQERDRERLYELVETIDPAVAVAERCASLKLAGTVTTARATCVCSALVAMFFA